MFEALFWVSYVALWILMCLVLAAVFFLYRHYGNMFVNSSEGRANQGPELNTPLTGFHLRDTSGANLLMGQLSNSSQFVFFASIKCGPCVRARKALGGFAERHKGAIETIVVCQGNEQQVREFSKDMPTHVRTISDPKWEIGTDLRVSTTPFALVTDEDGSVIAKGMPDNEEAFRWFSKQIELTERGRTVSAILES